MVDIRPAQLKDWQKLKRKWVNIPIEDVEAFALVWSAWWAKLQPHGRVLPDGRVLPPSYDTDWTCLRKPGANGLQLLLVTLRWWGHASHASPAWRVVVADFAATLCCVLDGVPGMRPEIDGLVPSATAATAAPRSKRKRFVEPEVIVTGKRVRVERVRTY